MSSEGGQGTKATIQEEPLRGYWSKPFMMNTSSLNAIFGHLFSFNELIKAILDDDLELAFADSKLAFIRALIPYYFNTFNFIKCLVTRNNWYL